MDERKSKWLVWLLFVILLVEAVGYWESMQFEVEPIYRSNAVVTLMPVETSQEIDADAPASVGADAQSQIRVLESILEIEAVAERIDEENPDAFPESNRVVQTQDIDESAPAENETEAAK